MSPSKQALRRYFLALRRARSTELQQQISEAICAHTLAMPLFQKADTVFIYVSTAGEIATEVLIDEAIKQGKCVCVPRCEAHGTMTARQIRSRDMLVVSRLGLSEPTKDAPIVPPDRIALVLAPALACDTQGYRLGYGGGYYDRFLAQTQAQAAVLCAQACMVDRLPREPYDYPCRWMVTEEKVHDARA